MSRVAIFVYGVASYLVFFAVFLYGIGFIGGFLTPTLLDGVPHASLSFSVAVDIALLAAFAIQHSGMARPAFKRWWTQAVPQEAERSTYVLFSSLALAALFVWWQPIGGMLWLVWWAIRKADEEPVSTTDEDGGSKVNPHHRRHPRPPRPPRPRRGPHAGAAPPAPKRIRSVVAFASKVEH